jgi:ferredoxin
VDECPVTAIFSEDEVPEKWSSFIELNKKYAAEWPMIEEGKEPLDTADEYKDKEGKTGEFSPEAAS